MAGILRIAAFAIALTAAAPVLTPSLVARAAPAAATTAPSQSPAVEVPQGTIRISDLDDAVVAEIMAHFVVTFYLSGKSMSPAEIEQLYAPRVRYFDGTELTRKAVIRDKLDYFKRWPDRTFSLVPDTMEVFRDESDLVDVTFQYEFVVRSPKRTSRGRGNAKLTLDFTEPAGRIVREEGDVISRY